MRWRQHWRWHWRRWAGSRGGLATPTTPSRGSARELARKNSQLSGLSILIETNSREQVRLYAAVEQTTALLRRRRHRAEELKRENGDLRRWADTPLPADIIRLRKRPALAGGAAYRQWLSQSDAVPLGEVSAAQ
ncbi:Rz-like lysis system protein LysB [Edwardsiella tarda]|uniref:Rz-like lysis system protein LysB n=1 Tax=Edwardsiella tarda TaxID=636 RepID=UPI00351BF82A